MRNPNTIDLSALDRLSQLQIVQAFAPDLIAALPGLAIRDEAQMPGMDEHTKVIRVTKHLGVADSDSNFLIRRDDRWLQLPLSLQIQHYGGQTAVVKLNTPYCFSYQGHTTDIPFISPEQLVADLLQSFYGEGQLSGLAAAAPEMLFGWYRERGLHCAAAHDVPFRNWVQAALAHAGYHPLPDTAQVFWQTPYGLAACPRINPILGYVFDARPENAVSWRRSTVAKQQQLRQRALLLQALFRQRSEPHYPTTSIALPNWGAQLLAQTRRDALAHVAHRRRQALIDALVTQPEQFHA